MSTIRGWNAKATVLCQQERDIEPVYVVPDAGGRAFHRIENAPGAVARRYSTSSDMVGGDTMDPRSLSGDFDILIDEPAAAIDHLTV